MGGVMTALAKVTAVCDGLNTAFDAIGKCCNNFCGQTNTKSTPVGSTTTTNNQSPTNNQLISVGNKTTTNNTQSPGNNQYILINVGERASQLPSVGSVAAAVLAAAAIGAYLTHRLRKKGDDGSTPVGNTTTTNNQSVGNTTTTSNTQSSGSNQLMELPSGERTSPPAPPQIHSGEGTTSSPAPSVEMIEAQRTQPYGHPGGARSFDLRGLESIKIIEIRCGSWIDSLRFQYMRGGNLDWTSQVGGGGGGVHTIELNDEEQITEVTGEYAFNGETGMGIIARLRFTTNHNRRIGPYGEPNVWMRLRMKFLPFHVQGRIVGFHGTAAMYISSIGFYTLP